MEIATKDRWKLHPMIKPRRLETIINLTFDDVQKIKIGYLPQSMEDKWFIYFEDDWLYLHSSWKGTLVYKAQIYLLTEKKYQIKDFWIEQDKEIDSDDNEEKNILIFKSLIKFLSVRKITNPVKNGIFGLVVGDALGVPVEFKTRNYLKEHPIKSMVGFGTHNQPPGTWSDDSSMTLCLADELSNEYNLENIGNSFVNWLFRNKWTANGVVFDVGITTRKSIQQLKEGISPYRSGNLEESSNGNGSLMRILPLLFHIKNLKKNTERFQIIKDVSSITHAHIISCLSCYYYLEFASFISSETKYSLVDAYKVANNSLKELIKELEVNTNELNKFNRLLDGNINKLLESEINSSGYVIDTLEAAIWSLLTSKSFEEAVLKAVNLGEDTDTVAAVTGSLAGLYYGFDTIPKEWITKIARFKDIEELINKLSDNYKIARL